MEGTGVFRFAGFSFVWVRERKKGGPEMPHGVFKRGGGKRGNVSPRCTDRGQAMAGEKEGEEKGRREKKEKARHRAGVKFMPAMII